ncbi:Metallo-dependent phosphatase-like protein [Diplogelasinospora grovesii]|uniref:Metallo-dependent phosphatase-like protein n=1 Tax=Diplogelasinospora grovesii TaxID=303347 RepID=A0AAN6N589_9PEZI|nr:Metallo-dependent phosphatase-like protein [Diplogelasinospora grovesii]
MTSTMHPLTIIQLRGSRKRRLAHTLRNMHMHAAKPKAVSPPPDNPIRVVCISDTHNTRPVLPPGDVLIHAGDLAEKGSFDEVQAGLQWLSDQSQYRYKVLIAGNHDVLLDEAFLAKYPERRYGQTKTKDDLDWGSVIYLQDTSVTLEFPSRSLTIFGSPWTPQYGISAFQYPPGDGEGHWTGKFASLDSRAKPLVDIVVTHGPPKHHLDARDLYRAGCPYLAEELARLKPRLHVFGHIHVSYGHEDVVLDGVQRAYEEVMTGWGGWTTVGWMAVLVLWGRLKWLFGKLGIAGKERAATTFVNASVVSGRKNELCNEPIVVEL